jgi:hypothetical protein
MQKKPLDPDKNEIGRLILEIENCLAALKRKLNLAPNPVSKSQIVASAAHSAFGRRTCANRPLRSSTAPTTPVVHPQLGSL